MFHSDDHDLLNKRIYIDTKFSCVGHFEAFLDFLCNGNRAVLENLQYFSYEGSRLGGKMETYPNRDRKKIQKPRVPLTYRDKAYIYFMREVKRISLKEIALVFGISYHMVRLIIITWARVCDIRYAAFGMYLTWSEYKRLAPVKWQEKYLNRRCHLWDTSNFSLQGKPRLPHLQRSTWNDYYNENCYKVGVGCIPSCWNMSAPLWTG